MRARFCGTRSTQSWTAIGAGIGAALGAATHAMAECLAICIAAGALADALFGARRAACAPKRRSAQDDGDRAS